MKQKARDHQSAIIGMPIDVALETFEWDTEYPVSDDGKVVTAIFERDHYVSTGDTENDEEFIIQDKRFHVE